MGDFLSRPTLIKTLSWLPAGVSDSDFDPWTLFLSSTEIKKKLDNFAFFRGDMHIKVVVNASPFYYGAMLINYTPIYTAVMAIDNNNVTALVPQSQKPHVWIDLRTNMGGEMILPFVWNTNYVQLTSASAVASLGRMRNITYMGLKSANGATVTGVTVKVYAWMENVELSGNTVTLALQAKKQIVKDEYAQDGVISKPATSLAHWASYLLNVPIIGPYAKATQIGASAVASVAGLFGWSKVPVIEDVKPVKPLFFHDLASAHLSGPTSKVTLDPKSELSVDPRIVYGSDGADELSISNLVQKDSFLFSTTWNTNDPPDTLMAAVAVSPYLMNKGNPTNSVYVLGYTPMAYIGSMFDSWRGDVIFTIKVICSQYHRGRLRVHWDPVPATSTTTDITNRTLTKIIDIGECTEIEFRVPYAQYAMWSQMRSAPAEQWSITSPSGLFDNTFDNGMLTVRVLNNLSAPIDTASVGVFMFVRGAENLEFANPRDLNHYVQPFVVQSMVEEVESDTQAKSTPLQDRYLINWGEAIPSLRLLLQRSALVDTLSLNNLAALNSDVMQRWYLNQTRFPPSPGYDPNGAYAAKGVVSVTDKYYNYVNHTPLSWITPMYVARRGSIQWHYHFNDFYELVSKFKVTRLNAPIGGNSTQLIGEMRPFVVSSSQTRNVTALAMRTYNSNSFKGVVMTDSKVSPAISIEMPQMSRFRFQWTDPEFSLIGNSNDGSNSDTYKVEAFLDTIADKNAATFVERYCNAGTDYSLSFFLCAPHMCYCTSAGDSPV